MSVADALGCFSRADASNSFHLIPGAASPRRHHHSFRRGTMARLACIAGLDSQPPPRDATRPARSMKASSHPYYNCMTRPHLGLIGPRALFARGSTHIQPTFLPETGTNSGRALRIGAPFSSHHRQALAPSIPGLAQPPLQLAVPEPPAPGVTPPAAYPYNWRPRRSQDRARAPPAGRRIARRTAPGGQPGGR
jgi:hypothetical protein